MAIHSERLAKFEEAVYKQKEEMQEKMKEMMSLVVEYANKKTPRNDVIKKRTRYPHYPIC
jgi:hypothetical protein